MKIPKLKPCPFCGSKQIILDCWEGIYGMKYYVLCKKCKISLCLSDGFMVRNFTTAEAAEKAWNRRSEVKGDADAD